MKTLQKKLLYFLLMLPISLFAQNKLSGVVLDGSTQEPLPGVNVIVQGTTNGTATDFDGNFTLSNLKQGDKVVFSYIGFKDETLIYNNQSSVSISMQEDAQQLQDVLVIGYGTTTKKDATGSLTSVTTEDFVKGPVVAVDQMIQGKVAGLQISSGGGSPGEGSEIRIRSGASLSANNNPLFVVDGVPLADGGVNGGRNPLATINQNNIESVTVLKDASALAIYGSRASNGVIIITTKKGKAGELQVNYNGNVSMSTIADRVDVLSTQQFRDYVTANGTATQIGLMGNASTDWQDEIYRKTTLGTDHNVSLSGGKDFLTYRASIGLTDMNGVLLRDNMNRATLGASLVGKFFDNHLKIEVNNQTASMKNDYSNRGAIGSALGYDPTQSVRNDDGTFYQWSSQLAGRNPVALIKQTNNYGYSYRSLGNVQAEYKMHFLPELKAVANLGYDYLSGRSYGNTSTEYFYTDNRGDSYNNENTRKNRLMDLYLNYKKDVDAIKGSVELTGGYSYQNFKDEASSFSFDGNSGNIIENVNFPSVLNLQSFFGRAIFNFSNKYILTATYRRDGSSRFTEDFRWGNFPSAAFAWKLSEEKMFKNVSSISDLKLRLGWGITGQQDIGGVYPSTPLYLFSNSTAQYPFGNNYYATVRPQNYNPNLKWEETETRNAGLDMGFLDNRITASIDVYEKRTKDLLARIPNPSFFGFSNYDNYNIGSVKNQGIEFTAEVVPVKTDNVNLTIGGNITFQNSKVTGLINGADQVGIQSGPQISGGIDNYVMVNLVDYAPNSFLVYEQAYDTNGNPIDGAFVDRNEDGDITLEDRYVFRKPAADVFYGFYTNFSYKKFDFTMSWRGSWGNYIYNNVDSNLGWQNQVLIRDTDLGNAVTNILDTNFSSTATERYLSDYYIQDASFIRLDNATVGYTFDKFLGTKASAKISLAGQNLLLFTDYKGLDPEMPGGIDYTIYPRPRMYTLGLNVNF